MSIYADKCRQIFNETLTGYPLGEVEQIFQKYDDGVYTEDQIYEFLEILWEEKYPYGEDGLDWTDMSFERFMAIGMIVLSDVNFTVKGRTTDTWSRVERKGRTKSSWILQNMGPNTVREMRRTPEYKEWLKGEETPDTWIQYAETKFPKNKKLKEDIEFRIRRKSYDMNIYDAETEE